MATSAYASTSMDLDCPVCFEKMRPATRIFQCIRGHSYSLCEQCKDRARYLWVQQTRLLLSSFLASVQAVELTWDQGECQGIVLLRKSSENRLRSTTIRGRGCCWWPTPAPPAPMTEETILCWDCTERLGCIKVFSITSIWIQGTIDWMEGTLDTSFTRTTISGILALVLAAQC